MPVVSKSLVRRERSKGFKLIDGVSKDISVPGIVTLAKHLKWGCSTRFQHQFQTDGFYRGQTSRRLIDNVNKKRAYAVVCCSACRLAAITN